MWLTWGRDSRPWFILLIILICWWRLLVAFHPYKDGMLHTRPSSTCWVIASCVLLYSKSNAKSHLWRGCTILWRRVSLHHLFLHVFVVHLNYCINRGVSRFATSIFIIFSHCCTAPKGTAFHRIPRFFSVYSRILLVIHAPCFRIVGRTSDLT